MEPLLSLPDLQGRAWPAALTSGCGRVGVAIGSRALGWWRLYSSCGECGRKPPEREGAAVGDLQRV